MDPSKCRRRPRRLSPAVLEALEARTLLTLGASLAGNVSTFAEVPGPATNAVLQIPSPNTPITTDLTNNQFDEFGNTTGFDGPFDFNSAGIATSLPALSTSTVKLAVAGMDADYTFQLGPTTATLAANFEFTGGNQNNLFILDFGDDTQVNPISGGSAKFIASADTSTNTLQIKDTKSADSTAVYNLTTKILTFAGQNIDVSGAANLTIDLKGTLVTDFQVINPGSTATPSASYDPSGRVFKIGTTGPAFNLPAAGTESIDLNTARIQAIKIQEATPSSPSLDATFTISTVAAIDGGKLELGGNDTVLVPFQFTGTAFTATQVDLSDPSLSLNTLTVQFDAANAYQGFAAGFLLKAASPAVSGIFNDGGATPFLLYQPGNIVAATSALTIKTGAQTGTSLAVDKQNADPVPAGGLDFDATDSPTPGSLAVRNATVTTATIDLDVTPATVALDSAGVIQLTKVATIDVAGAGTTVAAVTLNMSAANPAVTLSRKDTATNAPFQFSDGATNPTVIFFPANTLKAVVNGVATPANTLTVDYQNGNPIPYGGLTFDGKGNGTLKVTDGKLIPDVALASVAYTATAQGAGRLVLDSGTVAVPDPRAITFVGLKPVFIAVQSIDTVSIDAAAPLLDPVGVSAGPSATPGEDRVIYNNDVLESIQFTSPKSLILSASGGQVGNTYTYDIPSFQNNVTIYGGAAKLVVNVARAAAAANKGTLTVNGGTADASLALSLVNGDPIPAASDGGIVFRGGTKANSLSVVNPPAANPPAATNLRAGGPSLANELLLGFDAGNNLAAYGLNRAIDLTAGVTKALNVTFVDTTNAIGLKTANNVSLISLNGAEFATFDPAQAKTNNVALTGGAFVDSLSIDFAGGNPLPATFAFNGGAGTNSLAVINANTAATFNAGTQTVTLAAYAATIPVTNVSTVDLSGSTLTTLEFDLPAANNALMLSLVSADGPAKLAYGVNFGSTLLYPTTTGSVTLKGGAAATTLTINLGNGNPLPAQGLFDDLTSNTALDVVYGLAKSVTLDTTTKTLTIDARLVRFVGAVPAVDLSQSAVSSLSLIGAGPALTLSKSTAALPLVFVSSAVPRLSFADSTPDVSVTADAAGSSLTLDYTNGTPLPTRKLTFLGTAGAANELIVVGNPRLGTVTYTVGAASNTLLLDSGLVELVNPRKVSLYKLQSLGNLVVNLANVNNDVQFNTETGGLNRIGLGTNDLIAYPTPTKPGTATINGGTAADTYTLVAGSAVPLVINDTAGAANKLVIDFDSSNAAKFLGAATTYHGSGKDNTIETRNGNVSTGIYEATGPGAGILTFAGSEPLTFSGISGDPVTPAIDLTGAGLAALIVKVTDGVGHTYTINAGGVTIDLGIASVKAPVVNRNLSVTAGPGVDRFLVNATGFSGPGYQIDGGGGQDTMNLDTGTAIVKEYAESNSKWNTGRIDAGNTFTLTLSGAGVPNVTALSFLVTNDHDAGLGSLRSAILNVNLAPGNTVSSDDHYSITPATSLPAVDVRMTFTGDWMALGGSDGVGDGLRFNAGASGSSITGVTLNKFSNVALFLDGVNDAKIRGVTAQNSGVGLLIQDTGSGGNGNALSSIVANANGVGVRIMGVNAGGNGNGLTDSTANGNGTGLLIDGSGGGGNRNTVQGLKALDNTAVGVRIAAALGGGTGNRLIGIAANSNGVGILITSGTGGGGNQNTLTSIGATGNTGAGVQILAGAGGGSNNTLTSITSYSNGVGVQIEGASGGGSNNTLTASFIGYNPGANDGDQKMPSKYGNVGYGVLIAGGSNNMIGLSTNDRKYDNVISGNGLAGVGIVASAVGSSSISTPAGNIVQNNIIGLNNVMTKDLDPKGRVAVGNLYGVYAELAGANTIRDNMIGGNGRYGVYLVNSDNVRVLDNVIGDTQTTLGNLNAAKGYGNFGDGINVDDSIGTKIKGNTIVGNAYPVGKKRNLVYFNPPYPHPNSRRIYKQSFLGNGIHLFGKRTKATEIVNNRIGLTKSNQSRPNQAFAILIDTGARSKTITGNQFSVSNYAPEVTVYDLTKLGLKP